MIIKSKFRAPWWLKNYHLQTIWSSKIRQTSKLATRHQRLELDDGDFIELEWLTPLKVDTDAPILLLLHGLEGSIDSSYIQGILQVSQSQSWNTVVMHFRGCGKEMNRLARSYHSGETDDLQQVLEVLKEQYPKSKILAAGFSLGGNVLLKYLGERQQSLIDCAAVVSVPFLLGKCASRLDQGFSRFYRYLLLKDLRQKTNQKLTLQPNCLQLSKTEVTKLNTFYDFDDKVTAPLHGFNGAQDYYQQCSSHKFLTGIRQPTLILQAADDPFMTSDVIPNEDEISDAVTLEISSEGGHVGFVTGKFPWRASYYIDSRIPAWFEDQLRLIGRSGQYHS
ncbi:MAG: hydrolase [Gammaproteobacteria bacterium]|nr:MAG: hydrolase [Gammaproteobacteria bacterium]